MAENIMQTAFRWLKKLCERRFEGPKHYVNNVSVAQNIMQTGFRWRKILCQPDFYCQTIMETAFPWLKTLCKQRFGCSKHDKNSVSIAQNIMQTAF